MNLKDYIQGKRHGKEANQLEREAMNDPFLQDAIDGYDSLAGNHLHTIEKLEKKIAHKPARMDKRVWIWVAAALLLLLIGIPFLLRQSALNEETIVVASESPKAGIELIIPEKDSVAATAGHIVKTEKKTVLEKESSMATADHIIEAEKKQVPEKSTSVTIASRIVETEMKPLPDNYTSTLKQPERKLVQGRLTDQTGNPLVGATVTLSHLNVGTVTDTAGKFSMDLPKEAVGNLLLSYIGMESKEIPLKEHIGTVQMEANADLLSEVVVIGYGTQRKNTTTGAVAQIREDVPTFGETEFTYYFEENYDDGICEEQEIIFEVTFFIDANGHPGSIHIKENNCPAMETEIKRLLLGSPRWSEVNRPVTLKIEL